MAAGGASSGGGAASAADPSSGGGAAVSAAGGSSGGGAIAAAAGGSSGGDSAAAGSCGGGAADTSLTPAIDATGPVAAAVSHRPEVLMRRAAARAVEKLIEIGARADPENDGRSAELNVTADVEETTSECEDTDSNGRHAVEHNRL